MPDQTLAYTHNARPVGRQAFYALACDPAHSVAVEACAGAGKTWMLVSRIVRALLAGTQPHEIVAITFTKKAAGEMRLRLQQWLAQWAACGPEERLKALQERGIDLQNTAMPAASLASSLQNLYQTVLAGGRAVQIRTFHSWFAALLRAAPLAVLQQLGLPARYELLQDDDRATALVWPRLWAALLTDAALRADYAALVAAHGRHNTLKALQAALARRTEFALADAAGVVEHSVPPFGALFAPLAGLAEPAAALAQPATRARWLAAAQALGAEKNKTPQAAAAAIVNALCPPSGAQAQPAAGLLAQLRKALFVAGQDRLSKNLQAFAAAQELESELQTLLAAQRQHQGWLHQQRMARLTRRLLADYAALKRERGWVDMNDVESAAVTLLADPVLSGWVQQRLDASVRHLLIDEFQDTNPLQWQALLAWLSGYAGAGGGGYQPPSVFIVGDPKQSIYRFRRAEPQVFAAAQQFIVEGLNGQRLACDHTHRNAPAVLASVNAVMQQAAQGDDYAGFRPHTTESAQTGLVATLPLIERAASTPRCPPGAPPALAPWRDSLTTPRRLPEATLREHESVQAAHWVAQQLQNGVPPGDILVLARKRDRLAALQTQLDALGIAADQPEKTELIQAQEVQDVVALVDVLTSPGHNLSLARVLKSPMAGLCSAQGDGLLSALALAAANQPGARPSAAWLYLLLNSQRMPQQARQNIDQSTSKSSPEKTAGNTAESACQDAASHGALARLAALLTTLPPAFHAFATRLPHWQHLLRTMPPHDALQTLFDQGDWLARYAASSPPARRARVLANLHATLAAALQVQAGRYLSAYAWVRAMRQGGIAAPRQTPATPQSASVRLLTIHGAKGLEARAVLLLDADAEPPRAETMGVLIDWPGQAPAPRQFVFIARESAPPPSAAALLAHERQQAQREELNALYVAMTRARQQLVASAVQRRGQNGPPSWWQRLMAHAQPLAAPPEAAGATPAPQTGDDDPITLPCLPALPAHLHAHLHHPDHAALADAPPATQPAGDPAAAPTDRIGQAMHHLLEQTTLSPPPWNQARLTALAQRFGLTTPQAQQAAALAARILGGQGAWAWDSAHIDWAGDEVPLFADGQLQRIDRLVRRRAQAGQAATWWVLDYKSASQPEQDAALRAQLATYRAAVQALNPGQPVKAAFLTATGRLVDLAELKF